MLRSPTEWTRFRRWWRALGRRRSWVLNEMSARQAFSVGLASAAYACRAQRVPALPPVLKIDISPLCNLRCSWCLHADPCTNPAVPPQHFRPEQKMTLEQFSRIVQEIEGRSSAVTLFYFGDPFVHPDVDQMCRVARAAGLNSQVSSNLSFPFSDGRIESIATCGLTNLTVCVDGMDQQTYERTRIGGRLGLVLDNLTRLCEYKREHGLRYPRIEVQFLTFAHNEHQIPEARELCRQLGVEQLTLRLGQVEQPNVAPAPRATARPRGRTVLPLCWRPFWTMLIKWNGDVIPCCMYRLESQYTDDGDPRALGNVFGDGVERLWNSPAYQATRRLVCDPAAIERDAELRELFCVGCPSLYRAEDDHMRFRVDLKTERLA